METITMINEFISGNILWFVLGFAVIAIVLLALLITVMVRQKKLRKKYERFMQGKEGKDLEETVLAGLEGLKALQENQEEFQDYVKQVIEAKGKKSLYKTCMVRYDALEGAGGQMSFAWALLDDNNDGYLINHIYYRDGSSIFGKIITGGESAQRLSEEEQQALDGAKACKL